ncbi:hypothetical protein JHK82_044622 [Glycine max]|nr:hypothetical protein JHK82_044622 [Glycine max]
MEVDLPIGWKLLNTECYDETINLDEHMDVFLTQDNLYNNHDTILCRILLASLRGAALTCFEYAMSWSHRWTSTALASLRQPYDLASLWIVCTRNLLEAWMSYVNEPKATFRWKKCQHSEMKFDRLDTREKKGPRYEHHMPLTTNRATILEEAFNMEIPIQLPHIPPPRPGLDITNHYRYHCNHGYNT